MGNERKLIQEKENDHWHQGDCVVDSEIFISRFNPDNRVTEASQGIESKDETVFVGSPVYGFSILTQTCDIIKPVKDRPYVEIAPLVKVSQEKTSLIIKKKYPQYAAVPSLISQNLVVDLDRTMTVEKPVLDQWKRIIGCSTDKERRDFSAALSRKRARAALPDDFNGVIQKLQERWKEKHGKNSDEGKILSLLQEIRVQPSPDWSSRSLKVKFWFMLPATLPGRDPLDRSSIDKAAREWLERITTDGTRFESVDYQVVYYSEMAADEFIASDPLDYDHLSQ